MPCVSLRHTTLGREFGQKHVEEWTPNTGRLVRSAMSDERYCSFILDCIHETQLGWSLRQLNNMWGRAAASDLTVEQFINKERKR